MPDFPPVRFLGSSFLGEIPLADLDPQATIPLERPGGGKPSFFRLPAYFQGIEQILRKNRGASLLGALGNRIGRPPELTEIREIRIYSEKHGRDYHPAKIEVQLGDRVLTFAMNVALTERGCQVLVNEFQVLNELKGKFPVAYLPTVYFLDETPSSQPTGGPTAMVMYLAEWLEGFYEFHLAVDPADGRQKLVLWDTAGHNCFLTPDTADRIYGEISSILTRYYDFSSFYQIHPWHLAAGDFIARIDPDRVAVRLVAARQYGPLIGPPDLPPEEALFFFLLNLTLHLRLDRLDGVGELVWAEAGVVEPAVHGFWRALAEKEQRHEVPQGFHFGFRAYLRSLTGQDLAAGLEALIDSGDPRTPERSLIKANGDRHLEELAALIL